VKAQGRVSEVSGVSGVSEVSEVSGSFHEIVT